MVPSACAASRPPTLATSLPDPRRPLSPPPRETGTLGGHHRSLKLPEGFQFVFEKEKKKIPRHTSNGNTSIKEGYRNLCFQDHKGNLMEA